MGLLRPLIIISFFLLGGALETQVWARQDVVPGSAYTSGRGAAMGDAALPLADDGASALFYNPAGIAGLRRPQFEPFNLRLEGNQDYAGLLNMQSFKVTSLSSYASQLDTTDKMPGVGGAFLPTFSVRGFAFGLLGLTQFAAMREGSNYVYRSKYQFIPALGFGIPLARGIVRLGYSLHWINEASGTVEVPTSSSTLGYNQNLLEGNGFSHNFGFQLTFPVRLLPSLSFVARNIGGTAFRSGTIVPLGSNSTGTLPTRLMSLDAAFSIQPKTGKGGMINFVVEGRDLSNTSQTSILLRLATGLEFNFRRILTFRLGYGSGYPALGLGLAGKKSEFSFSWYSEEVGASFHAQRDSRFMLQYRIKAF